MNLITLTEALRKQIIENYYKYKKELYNDDNIDDELENEVEFCDDETGCEYELEDDDDEYTEELYSIYDDKIVAKLIDDINGSEYKKLIHFIILSDCLEYIKAKTITKRFISNDEKYLLILLENFDTQKLLDIIDKDEEFLLDIMTIFLEYNIICTNAEKYENRLLLRRQKSKIYSKFKLSILDDLQEYYEKNK